MLAAINILREISQKCRAGDPLDPDLSNWLAVRLDRFLEHQCTSMVDALELRQPRGGVPWWLIEALYERDAALRCLALEVAGDYSLSSRAREVRQLTTRYATSAWRFDQHREAMPASYRGTWRENVWRAFKSGAPLPLSERQLRKILAD